MRRTPPLVLAASLLACTLAVRSEAADADDANTVPHAEVRREILSEFKFVPSAAAEPVVQSPLLAPGATPGELVDPLVAGTDIVYMAAYSVSENIKAEKMHSDILIAQKQARTDAVMTKLGIGIHVSPAIGPLRFYAATLFYIPFNVGFGFSW
jgi:hypothetical protein